MNPISFPQPWWEFPTPADLDRAERIDGPDGTTGFVGDFRTYALATRGLGPLTTYACPLGPDCVYIMHTEAGTDIQVVEGEPIRIVGRTIDERPYRVVARGKAGPAFEALAADALAIADSLELLADDEATPSPQLLATVGSRTDRIPPGEYVARLGDEAVVGFSVTDEVGPIALDFGGEERVTLDVDGVATVSLLAPHWIDPAAAQTADDPSEADLLGRRVDTTADYDAWSSGFRDSEELGRLSVSGRDAVRFGGPLGDDAPTWPCADRPGLVGTRCVWLYLVDDAWWYGNDVPVTDGGGYHIDGTGLLLVIDADEQSTDVATEIQPLLDAITIRPLDPTGPGNE